MSDSDPKNPRPFSADDLVACRRVLDAIVADRGALAELSSDERRALLIAAGLVARPERHDSVRFAKAMRKRDRTARRERDRATLDESGLRVQRRASVFTPHWVVPPADDAADRDEPQLEDERACYVCKTRYRSLHFFYDSMCTACGDFNYARRTQTASLEGRVALVTGARVKIGFQIALKLLRAGARVLVTTRFPHDAAARYAREDDFAQWSHRLAIHGLDLRHAPSVELFARHLDAHESRLDFLVNNACQTVRRPPGFYAHLLDHEATTFDALPDAERAVLADGEALRASLRIEPGVAASTTALSLTARGDGHGVGLWGSATLSQLRFLDEDYAPVEAAFPSGRYDEDLQQQDLRAVNSWRLTLAQVPTPELLEVHLVNAISPFILNARLKGLMLRQASRDKHIVNVSAMEGQFYRAKKTDRHPHTNMAKAALNMLTRTSAIDYARDGIFMNAVDTGWVTDEDPAAIAARKTEELGFQPPLDIIDGAARVCDPIFAGFLTGEHAWGQFFKDYRPAPW